MSEEIKKMSPESKDLVAEHIEQLKQLFPEVVTEGDGSIDFEKLRLILGDEVNEDGERYAFTWPGKTSAIRQSQTPSKATLRPCPEKSVNWDSTENLYIEGDNLEVLKLLQHSYHGSVKMIYIDPPYNTGHDFVYRDTFSNTVYNYKEQAKISGQSKGDTSGRFHSKWCSMIYPRIKLARELLDDDGLIFVSIDDNEVNNLQSILREVFGERNMLASIIVTVKPEGRRYGSFAKTHEYLLVYAKDSVKVTVNEIEAEDARFSFEDAFGGYNLQGLRNRNVRAFNSINRPNLRYPFWVNAKSADKNGHCDVSVKQIEGWHMVYPSAVDGLESVWRWGKDKSANEVSDLTATLGKDGVYRVFQKVRSLSQTPKTTWVDKEYQSNRGTKQVAELVGSGAFDFPKPTGLLKQIVKIGCNENSLALDFFAGSGTLADAIMQINYETGSHIKCISVQLPESLSNPSFQNLCEVSEERIRQAGRIISSKAASNTQPRVGEDLRVIPDIGFRVLKLDESGINNPEEMTLVDNVIKEDRSDKDIIFEMMLKWGLELTLPIEYIEVDGYPCYSVAADELICCMAEGLTVEALQAIADREPRRVLMLDSVLTDTLKLNAVQVFKHASEKTGMEIELRTV